MESTQIKQSTDLLPTPPIPSDLPNIELSENARQILIRRFVRYGDDGQPVETPDEMFWRVAYHVAIAEEFWGGDVLTRAREFYTLLILKKFFPNSPTFTGAGTPIGQLAACFVLPINDDMGKDVAGIFQSLRNAALIQQTGGGNGFSFSRLRPQGAIVKSSAGHATGPVGFLRVYDQAFGEIAQGGTRRGANMAVLRVDHPDIEDFISCKDSEGSISNFNISVGITDSFMHAVINDQDWELRFPDVSSPLYRTFKGTLEQANQHGIPIKVYKKVRARELFNKIVRQAHHNGEPGVLFLDTANRYNPVPHIYQLEATNPCGEQWLGPHENCCLGSINLAKHCGPEGTVDWEALQATVELSVHFLDNVIEINAYVPAVPELKEAALNARRIGLGIMGLADMMYHCGVRYGSHDGQEFSSQLMEFIRYHAMRTSIQLARQRGAFPAIKGSIYDFEDMQWKPPISIIPHTHSWGRPELKWDEITSEIEKFGIRNAAQTTIAPTGTIATVAGCEGYGCEPVFALAYIRHVNDHGKDLQLSYTSPLFEAALENAGIVGEAKKEIIDSILQHGTCQAISKMPEPLRNVFVVAGDISAEEHICMQAAMQAFIDNSLSKTINFPVGASIEDVSKAYMQAWEMGCKGITVYVTGSRENVVLETKETIDQKEGKSQSIGRPIFLPFGNQSETKLVSETELATQLAGWHASKKPRPRLLTGNTYRIETPLGRAFVTVNENGNQQPFEVFINTAKAGSETAAVSEAIGRLISYILRLASPIAPRNRLEEVINQLSGIGGSRSLGFGPNRVRSLPDGVGQALSEYISGKNLNSSVDSKISKIQANTDEGPSVSEYQMRMGDLCPECGEASMVNEEGCRKCYFCGYSEC